MEEAGVIHHCLAGATATGKSAVAQILAERTGSAILSADSMLVYAGMDIGTAKPTAEERSRVPYFGLDCVTPAEPFTVASWLKEADRARAFCAETNRPLIVVGGTGLYFSALLRGLEPAPPANPALRAELEALSPGELRSRLTARGVALPDMANPRRLVRALEILESGGELPRHWGDQPKPALCALAWERTALHERIARRVEKMFAEGLLNETAELLRRYPVWSQTASQAIGYAEACAVLEGRLSLPEAQERTIIRTRQLARRQETYLRHQFTLHPIAVTASDSAETLADRLCADATF